MDIGESKIPTTVATAEGLASVLFLAIHAQLQRECPLSGQACCTRPKGLRFVQFHFSIASVQEYLRFTSRKFLNLPQPPFNCTRLSCRIVHSVRCLLQLFLHPIQQVTEFSEFSFYCAK